MKKRAFIKKTTKEDQLEKAEQEEIYKMVREREESQTWLTNEEVFDRPAKKRKVLIKLIKDSGG